MMASTVNTSKQIEVWTKILGDEDGMVSIGADRQIRLADLQKAIADSLGNESVSGIYGGQFRFRVQVPREAVVSEPQPQTVNTDATR